MKYKSYISKNFAKFLEALQDTNKKSDQSDITFQICYDLFRLREAQWKYKINSNRGVDYSLSDIFQDIIAHYLRITLPNKYKVLLEYKKGKLRPDILIKKDGQNSAILEIKTTIGWDRGLVKNDKYKIRLHELSTAFKIPVGKVFYVFESSRNVNKDFASLFKGEKKSEITKSILPLFQESAAPYYFSKKKKIEGFKTYSDKEIFDFYQTTKVTDWKDIIKKIVN